MKKFAVALLLGSFAFAGSVKQKATRSRPGVSIEKEANDQKEELDSLIKRYSKGVDYDSIKSLGDSVHDSRSAANDQIALALQSQAKASGGSSCASAEVLPVGSVVTGTTASAPTPGGVPTTCGDASLSGVKAVWFRAPAGISGTHYFSTCGTATAFDTQITVLTGNSCSNLSCVKGGDDDKFCSTSSTHSTVQFIADPKKQYYVLVHGYKADAGKFQLAFGKATINPLIEQNHKNHATDRYRDEDGSPTSSFLVVRRDVPVDIRITSADAVASLQLVLNDDASPADGNYELNIPAISPVAKQLGYTMGEFWATPVAKNGHAITWRLRLPEYAPVGQFGLKVIFTGGISIFMPVDMVVLFNPMSKNDDVYMADQGDLAEYVFNEFGAVFKGTSKSPYWSPWAYDQFNTINLITTNNMLVGATLAQRRSPVFITRRLSAKLAANNKGVVSGRWDGNYADGKPPGFWASSTDIFTKFTYGGTKSRVDQPVKYGQCFVFAAVFTTAMRTLGIPGRPITNFDSAHEAYPFDQNLDFYYRDDPNSNGLKLDKSMTSDSVWNYHVWNEGWFRRKDVQGGDGWQAVDATPQEKSSGPVEAPFSSNINQCGPASLLRMAAGDVTTGYDAPFIVSEVNGRSRSFSWSESEKKWKQIGVRVNTMGTSILTKMPDSKCNSEERDSSGKYTSLCPIDLRATGHYARTLPSSSRADAPPSAAQDVSLSISSEFKMPKFIKSITGGFTSLFKAIVATFSTITRPGKVSTVTEQSNDVVFSRSSPDHAIIGQAMQFELKAKAAGSTGYTGSLSIALKSTSYTGVDFDVVATQSAQADLNGGKTASVRLTVNLQQYEKFLGKSDSFTVTFSALLSNGQNYVYDDIVIVPPPVLDLKCPKSVAAGRRAVCKASFKNPLTVPLTNLKFLAHLTGHASNSVPEPIEKSLAPGETWSKDIALDARTPGSHAMIATLSTPNLKDVEASAQVVVTGKAVRNPGLDHRLSDLKNEKKPSNNGARP